MLARGILIILLFCSGFLGCFGKSFINRDKDVFPLTIVHVNDVHANFEQVNEDTGRCLDKVSVIRNFSYVSFSLYHVLATSQYVLCHIFLPCHMSQPYVISYDLCLISYVSFLMSHVSCLMSYVSFLMSHVSCLMSYIICRMSYTLYLMSCILCLMSYVLCHMFLIFLMSIVLFLILMSLYSLVLFLLSDMSFVLCLLPYIYKICLMQ